MNWAGDVEVTAFPAAARSIMNSESWLNSEDLSGYRKYLHPRPRAS